MIEYRGYTGVFEFDPELALFAGHVVDLQDEIYFEGASVDELMDSMRRAVNQYLSVCEERGDQPDRPFSGRFNVRVEPATHRRIVAAAAAAGLSMNEWMTGLVTERLSASQGEAKVLVLDDSH
jgi:predicted HicB family RNase H-like nuclease